jgi:hypothetical protein
MTIYQEKDGRYSNNEIHLQGLLDGLPTVVAKQHN